MLISVFYSPFEISKFLFYGCFKVFFFIMGCYCNEGRYMLHLEESSLLQWWSSWKPCWRTPKATHLRKSKPTCSTYHYHVPQDYLCEVQSSTLQKTWDSFSRELEGMRFPLTNDKCMTLKATSRKWNHYQRLLHSSFGACFSFSHSTFFILLAISCFFCEAMTHALPRLIDGSLLRLQHNKFPIKRGKAKSEWFIQCVILSRVLCIWII